MREESQGVESGRGVAGGPHGERDVGRIKGTFCRYKRGIRVQGFPALNVGDNY